MSLVFYFAGFPLLSASCAKTGFEGPRPAETDVGFLKFRGVDFAQKRLLNLQMRSPRGLTSADSTQLSVGVADCQGRAQGPFPECRVTEMRG